MHAARVGRIWGAIGFAATIFLSMLVALFSLRFAAVPWGHWLQIDRGIEAVMRQFPPLSLAHTLVPPIAVLVGPFQFWTGLRQRRPRLHRILGASTSCAA